MTEIKKILVPTDFSESSTEAGKYALFLAEKFGATVDFLHIWEQPYYFDTQMMLHSPGGGSPQTIADFVEAQAKEDMKKYVEGLAQTTEAKVTQHFVHGITYSKIVEMAEKENSQLIVMGTHGRTGFSRLVLGSVAEKVLRHAPCPVLTIGPTKK